MDELEFYKKLDRISKGPNGDALKEVLKVFVLVELCKLGPEAIDLMSALVKSALKGAKQG